MDRSEFERRLKKTTVMSELVGRQVSVQAITTFVELTESIPADAFDCGINKAMGSCRFMPSPVEFREMALGTPSFPSLAELNEKEFKTWGGVRH